MFHAFPHNRSEWLRALQFGFRAYIPIAYCVGRYFIGRWPPHIAGYYYGRFRFGLTDGYMLVFVALFIFGVIQLFRKHWRDALLNFCFAALSVFLALKMGTFVYL
jgi:hypothetical protein